MSTATMPTRQSSTSISSRIDADPGFALRLAVLRGAVESEGLGFVTSHELTASDRTDLTERRRVLDRALAPTHSEQGRARIRSALAGVFSGDARLRSADVAGLIDGYLMTLAQYPAWAVEAAGMEVARGAATGVSPDFTVTAARLAVLTREHMARYELERGQINTVLMAKYLPPPDPVLHARIGKMFAELTAELGDRLRHDPDLVEAEAKRKRQAEERRFREVEAARQAQGLPPTRDGALQVSPALMAAAERWRGEGKL